MTGDVAPFCAGSLLMSPDDGRIDHEPFGVGTGGQGIKNHLPDALARPAAKAPMSRVPVAIFLGQRTPARSVFTHPHHRLDKAPIVLRCSPGIAWLARQGVLDPQPLILSQMHVIAQQNLLVPQSLSYSPLNVHTA
jgi:hypothetical protein